MINILDKILKLSQYLIAILFITYICATHSANAEPKINYILILLNMITGVSMFNILAFIFIQNISQIFILLIFICNLLLSSMTYILIDIISNKAINNASFIWTGQMNMWDKFSIIFMLIIMIVTIIIILKNKRAL